MTGEEEREERESIGLSLEVLGAIASVSPSTISRWEAGLSKPTDATIRRILAALTNVRALQMIYEPIPLDLRVVDWIRSTIAKMNVGRDETIIRDAGEVA
jgi:transcriptional regulator with XRE-family HTH domain